MRRAATDLRRVLLYAHDTFGLGHLRRNLAIAKRLSTGRPGLQIVLMTGSPVAERFALPRGVVLVALPPVVKVGAEDYRPRDTRWDLELVRRARTAIMVDTARRFAPDVFLVDHAPQGMKAELLPVFSALSLESPRTRIVLGLRDVLDDPASVRRAWTEQDAYATLETVYDRILVYGSAELFDVVSAYGLSNATASKLSYCGYLCRPSENSRLSRHSENGGVLGTAGGGGDGAEVLSATLAASAALGVASLVVSGPLMSAADRLALEAQAAANPCSEMAAFIPDMGAAMDQADAVVTMGGYNSLCELVSRGVPTVVVPRVQPRREQAIRAELFAQRGLVLVVAPGADLEQRLEEALAVALRSGRHPGPSQLDLGGLDRVDDALETEARLSRARSHPPSHVISMSAAEPLVRHSA